MIDPDGEEYLAWLEERDWSELEVGRHVLYVGTVPEMYGVWRVLARKALSGDEDIYELVRGRHQRINADRWEMIPLLEIGKP